MSSSALQVNGLATYDVHIARREGGFFPWRLLPALATASERKGGRRSLYNNFTATHVVDIV
jgi:hypothetical protein